MAVLPSFLSSIITGSYSEWLKCHPDHLRSVLPVLLGGLSQEQLASASTQALRGICEECVQDLEPATLMEILKQCQVNLLIMHLIVCGLVISERVCISLSFSLSYT